MKRREFIEVGLCFSSLSILPNFLYADPGHQHPPKNPHPTPAPQPKPIRPPDLNIEVDVEIELVARTNEMQLLPGAKTSTWKYHARIIKGESDRVQDIDNSYLGPTLKFKKCELVRIVFKNELPEPSIVHWHGLDVPHEMDGHPHYVINPGQTYIYQFQVLNRAGTYWYHPHPHGRTGYQVFQGLAGVLIIEDAEEQNLNLPRHDQDRLLVIQDRRFNDQNQFVYVQNRHDQMMGLMGDKLFVNGSINREWSLNPGTYRIRILNGSNARPYNLKWSDGRSLVVIGVDGGLLEAPMRFDNLFIGSAERIEILVDITENDAGLALRNVPFATGGNGQSFDILKFQPTGVNKNFYSVPEKLCKYEKLNPRDAVNFDAVKSFKLIPTAEHGWTIDGQPYDLHGVSTKETCKLGTMEIWEFDNTIAGMPHPIHIHGSQFQVIERISGKLKGCMDHGWKDVVLLMPGDKVKVIKQFNNFEGDFIYHCHNLEHEDMSMMRNYRIKS